MTSNNQPAAVRASVRDAINRIEPLRGNGPNRFTVDVKDPDSLVGWGVSAPTKRELCRMLWFFFQPSEADHG